MKGKYKDWINELEYINIPKIRNQDFWVEEQTGIEKVVLERWGHLQPGASRGKALGVNSPKSHRILNQEPTTSPLACNPKTRLFGASLVTSIFTPQ